jgi:hypothetical protein
MSIRRELQKPTASDFRWNLLPISFTSLVQFAASSSSSESKSAPERSGLARKGEPPTSRATIPTVLHLISSRFPCLADSTAGRSRCSGVPQPRCCFRITSPLADFNVVLWRTRPPPPGAAQLVRAECSLPLSYYVAEPKCFYPLMKQLPFQFLFDRDL